MCSPKFAGTAHERSDAHLRTAHPEAALYPVVLRVVLLDDLRWCGAVVRVEDDEPIARIWDWPAEGARVDADLAARAAAADGGQPV